MFEYLIEAYMHLDWFRDYKDASGIWEAFKRDETSDMVASVIEEVRQGVDASVMCDIERRLGSIEEANDLISAILAH